MGEVHASPSLGNVHALVLEKASRDSKKATVLFEKGDFERIDGRPIGTTRQLTSAVILYVSGSMEKFRNDYDGDPVVFETDPRQGGSPDDDTTTQANRLRGGQLQKLKGQLDAARRGRLGENPYFVLVTRARPQATESPSRVDLYGMYYWLMTITMKPFHV